MGEELDLSEFFNLLTPIKSIYFVSIGCAESEAWINKDSHQVNQQYPKFLQEVQYPHKTLILIDEKIREKPFIEEYLLGSGHELKHSIKYTNIPGDKTVYIKDGNQIDVHIIRSNKVYREDFIPEDPRTEISDFSRNFYSRIMGQVLDTDSIMFSYAFSGHMFNEFIDMCDDMGIQNKIEFSITTRVDYSCYVPESHLTNIPIIVDEDRLEIKNVYSLNLKQLCNVYENEENPSYKVQISYRIFRQLRSVIRKAFFFMDYLEKAQSKNEFVHKNYWPPVFMNDELRAEYYSDNGNPHAIQKMKKIFKEQIFQQLIDFLPPDIHEFYQIEEFEARHESYSSILSTMESVINSIYRTDDYQAIFKGCNF